MMAPPSSRPPKLPDAPDPRVLPPETETFNGSEMVVLYGYIGEAERDHIRLHHDLDHRCYFRIPTRGIVEARLDTESKLENLYRLTVYATTPIRYYKAATVELTASILHKMVDGEDKARPRDVTPSEGAADAAPGEGPRDVAPRGGPRALALLDGGHPGALELRCRPDCPSHCCRNGQCICRPGGLMSARTIREFGLRIDRLRH